MRTDLHRGEPSLASDTAGLAERALAIALPIARGILGSTDQARDLAQDVTVEVIAGIGRLRDPAAFESWVRVIAVRRAIDAARRQRLRRSHETELLDDGIAAASDAADRIASRQAVMCALASLPVRQRAALVLRYYHDLSERDIAAALGCRPGTAASLISRGRAAMARHPAMQAYTSEERS